MYLDPVEHAAAHEAAIEQQSEAVSERHQALFLELVNALTSNPTARVHVPGYDYGDNSWEAHEVVSDWAAGDPTIMVEACSLIGLASRSIDTELRIRAQAWIARVSKMHADHHCEAED